MSTVIRHLPTYEEARQSFIDLARSAGGKLECWPHPELRDACGEPLSIDVARFGAAMPRRLLAIASGTHGVEGFAGSELQRYYIANLLAGKLASDQAVLLIHGLNPYGFSKLRRANESNVDLNRNSLDFGKTLPLNDGYDFLHLHLLPRDWYAPERADADREIAAFVDREGGSQFQLAISRGQHSHPDGMLFGGTGRAWSLATLDDILARHLSGVAYFTFLDIHTGLGPPGIGEVMVMSDDRNLAPDMKRRIGHVTILGQSDAISPPIETHIGVTVERAAKASIFAVALEFGTLPFEMVFNALRAETWHHINSPDSMADRDAKLALKSAFYVDTDAWRQSLAARFTQVIDYLAGV